MKKKIICVALGMFFCGASFADNVVTGVGATTDGDMNVVVGDNASAIDTGKGSFFSTVVGNSSQSTGTESTVVGSNSSAESFGTVVGAGSQSINGGAAFGYNNTGRDGGLAIGYGNTATANAVAIGEGNSISNSNSSLSYAVGKRNTVSCDNCGILFGTDQTLTKDNTVAFGGQELANIADGTTKQSAATVNQLDNAVDTINGTLNNHDARITANTNDISNVKNEVRQLDNRVGNVERRMDGVENKVTELDKRYKNAVASVLAIPVAMPTQVGKTTVAVGTGHYRGANALGLSIGHALNEKVVISAGMSYSGSETAFKTGLAYTF